MKSPYLAALLMISTCGFSQKISFKFGEISMEEMEMSAYKGDSSAKAVYLLDYGESNIIGVIRHVRIKVLKPAGLALANVSLSTYSRGRIANLKATTFNLVQGKIVATPLNSDAIFRQKGNRTTDIKVFTFPDVRVGSVIEYVYTLNSLYATTWSFQRTVPVEWSEFMAFVPDGYSLDKYLQGNIPASTAFDAKFATDGNSGIPGKTHRWILLDVPPWKEESFMPEQGDCEPKIELTMASKRKAGYEDIFAESWPALNASILNDYEFKKALSGADILSDKVKEIIVGVNDPRKKIQLIHDYVSREIAWDGTSGVVPFDVKKAIDGKSGSSSDINYILAAMLKNAGFSVDIVITSIRGSGMIRQEFPSIKQFNYALCAVRLDGKPIFLDATEKLLPYTTLPIHCSTSQGLVLSNIASGFVDLKPKVKAKQLVEADLSLDKSAAIQGTIRFVYDGYSALKVRKEHLNKAEDEGQQAIRGLHNLKVEKTDQMNMDDPNLPVIQNYQVVSDQVTRAEPGVVYFDPIVALREETPFDAENRTYPIDFQSPIERTSILKLTLPDDLTIDELPQSKIIRLPDNSAKYVFNVTSANNLISVTSTLQINKPYFKVDEYAQLREFYAQVIAKQAEQIVLRRK